MSGPQTPRVPAAEIAEVIALLGPDSEAGQLLTDLADEVAALRAQHADLLTLASTWEHQDRYFPSGPQYAVDLRAHLEATATATVAPSAHAQPDDAAEEAAADPVETCDMHQGEPYDFAWCVNHDTTFKLGETCKFNGRIAWEVYAEEADTQRGRAVRAEMTRDQALNYLSLYVDENPCAFDPDGRCSAHGPHPQLPRNHCAMPTIRSLTT